LRETVMTDEAKALREGIAANLRRVMRRRRVTPSRLGERSTLGTERVEVFLAAGDEPRVDEVLLLAGALGVEPAVLLEGIEWIPEAGEGQGRYRIRERRD
jgi:hypothetical protein